MIRQPYVAGYFYPSDPERLMSMLKEMIDADAKKNKAKCIISPHAGYVYSGKVAGSVYSSTILPENYVLLGPSHVYMDSRIAIMKQGTWRTPLGDIPVNEELAEMISSTDASVSEENEVHTKEHSLEVQLPFLQFFKKEFTIVPLCISYYADYGDLEELGKAVAKSIRELHKDTLIIASTDMSHQETQVMAKNKDSYSHHCCKRTRGIHSQAYKVSNIRRHNRRLRSSRGVCRHKDQLAPPLYLKEKTACIPVKLTIFGL